MSVCRDLEANYHTVPVWVISSMLYGMPINYLRFLPFVLYVCVPYMPWFLSFIFVCLMCRCYNWFYGCWLGTLINMNWIELNCTVLSLLIYIIIFLTSWGPVSFSGRSLPHAVRQFLFFCNWQFLFTIHQLETRRLGDHTEWAYREVLSPYFWARKLHIKMLPLPGHTFTGASFKKRPVCVTGFTEAWSAHGTRKCFRTLKQREWQM